MKSLRCILILSVAIAGVLFATVVLAAEPSGPSSSRPTSQPSDLSTPESPYANWPNGPGASADYFPIAVWLQSPSNAARYRQAGFNLYVGLWEGPTDEQLATLAKAGMAVICEQNAVALKHLQDKTIVGWMHGDEPDNAQSLGEGKGYGAPVDPAKIVKDYRAIQKADPSRPVMLNLGQGVAWDGWFGRGPRTNHPEDYGQYLEGCDIASFDIYPANHSSPQVAGKLWFVAQGVTRLRTWSHDRKIVWNCIECSGIDGPKGKPTPQQVRTEVWMSIIHGSRGLIYFVHQFKPKFNEHALLDDREMLAAVTALNKQVQSLAAVIKSPDLNQAVTVKSSAEAVPVAVMAKSHQGETYVFAVAMRDGKTNATFSLKGNLAPQSPPARVEVIDEGRTLPIQDNQFSDHFDGYQVHLYRIVRR